MQPSRRRRTTACTDRLPEFAAQARGGRFVRPRAASVNRNAPAPAVHTVAHRRVAFRITSRPYATEQQSLTGHRRHRSREVTIGKLDIRIHPLTSGKCVL